MTDTGDVNLEGVTLIVLKDEKGNVEYCTDFMPPTAWDGYEFTKCMPAGNYTVTETNPDGNVPLDVKDSG